MRVVTVVGSSVVAVALAAGGVAVGRLSAPSGSPGPTSAASGYSSGYAAGLRAGEQQGVREGRALQETAALSGAAAAAARRAYDDGYAAGADDVFSGYDGGWALGVPYVVTLEQGTDGVTYRLATRTTLQPGTTYRLCAGGHDLCPQH